MRFSLDPSLRDLLKAPMTDGSSPLFSLSDEAKDEIKELLRKTFSSLKG